MGRYMGRWAGRGSVGAVNVVMGRALDQWRGI